MSDPHWPLPQQLMDKVFGCLVNVATECKRTVRVATGDGDELTLEVDNTAHSIQAAMLLVKAQGQNLELDRRIAHLSD